MESDGKVVSEALTGSQPGLYIKTFGCQMNEYDSQKLIKILESQYRLVGSAEEAELVLINTCSVREKPERKLYSLLGELQLLKKSRPGLMVGVGGCVAQREGEQLVERSSAVDFVFGTHNLSLVPGLIQARRAGAAPQVAVDYRDEWEDLPLGFAGQGAVSVFVTISRGCDKSCSYCIVPTTRGSQVSRAVEEVEREVRLAVHNGAREVLLLGQSVNSYGSDLSNGVTFVDLLERISGITGLKRIRFTSPHPGEAGPEFVRYMAANPKICRHVHLPLQSGSSRILSAMNRSYDRETYLNLVRSFRAAMPDVALTTDIIVGFPGETEEDFEQTLTMMAAAEFENSFSFVYSPRPGTAATSLAEELTAEEKLLRLKRLQQVQLGITARRLKGRVGQVLEILIEGPTRSDPACLQGRSSQNTMVNLIRPVAGLKPGDVAECRVTEAARFSLRAEFCRVIV